MMVETPEQRRKKWIECAAFRFDMETWKTNSTRFCRQCGWRSNMSTLCYLCQPCDNCAYPRHRCVCESARFQKHLSDCEIESGVDLSPIKDS